MVSKIPETEEIPCWSKIPQVTGSIPGCLRTETRCCSGRKSRTLCWRRWTSYFPEKTRRKIPVKLHSEVGKIPFLSLRKFLKRELKLLLCYSKLIWQLQPSDRFYLLPARDEAGGEEPETVRVKAPNNHIATPLKRGLSLLFHQNTVMFSENTRYLP